MAKQKKQIDNTEKIRIIPLGGLHEIGKNMTMFEYKDEAIIVDCGLAFPDDEMLGIDYVIPDLSYVIKKKDNIKGVFITHGHEDHIGGIPYLLKQLNIPVYATRLTLGILTIKLKEHGILKTSKLIEVKGGQSVKLNDFIIEFIRVNHSIADSVAMCIHSPAGKIIHMGDFKLDTTPISGEMMDLTRLGELGRSGVLCLMSDSTNVERPGFSGSEKKVGKAFESLFKDAADSRIIIATFASNVHRVQQIIDAAAAHGRKVCVNGRSMVNVVNAATSLGYMKVPDQTFIELSEISRYPANKIVIITTGSQGEPMSGLYRMAFSDHKKVEINSHDFVIISASPVPGNENNVSKVVNELFKSGARVIYDHDAGVHVSGHACQEELKIVLALVKPKYFIPVHGEYRHLVLHSRLAAQMGVEPKNTFILNNGSVLELCEKSHKNLPPVAAGKVFVDGLGVGDVGSIVLRDRKHLAEDGLIVVVVSIDQQTGSIVAGPDIISRGFVYVREAEDLMENIRELAKKQIINCTNKNVVEWGLIKTSIRDALGEYLYSLTKRKPMILPVVMEV